MGLASTSNPKKGANNPQNPKKGINNTHPKNGG